MKKLISRKPMSVDLDHMRMLHQEATEQLELMHSVLEAAEKASDKMRDTLDDIAINHWNAYMDALHLICMHDNDMSAIMKKHGMKLRNMEYEDGEREFVTRRLFVLLLLTALIRRHRRIAHVYGLRGGPMSDYLQESLAMEREHMVELVAMLHYYDVK